MSRDTQGTHRSRFAVIYRAVTVYGRSFQIVQLTEWLVTCRPCGQTGPTTPPCKHDGLGYLRVRSPLLAESLLFSFPPGTEMVHFPGLSSPPYGFRWRYSGISLSGLPHSEILGSKPVCGSPKLFAAYHVLHRLLAPRHSPYALSSLTIKIETNARSSQLSAVSSQQLLADGCQPSADSCTR